MVAKRHPVQMLIDLGCLKSEVQHRVSSQITNPVPREPIGDGVAAWFTAGRLIVQSRKGDNEFGMSLQGNAVQPRLSLCQHQVNQIGMIDAASSTPITLLATYQCLSVLNSRASVTPVAHQIDKDRTEARANAVPKSTAVVHR
jgi:hypothetical protein